MTHCCSPSCYCQIDPQIQKGGMEYWIPDTMRFGSPLEMRLYRSPSPGNANPTCLRNRELGLMSGLWEPICANADWPGKGWQGHALRDAQHKGLYSALLPSLHHIPGWYSEAPICLDHGCGDQGHQGGYHEGHKWQARGSSWSLSLTGTGR